MYTTELARNLEDHTEETPPLVTNTEQEHHRVDESAFTSLAFALGFSLDEIDNLKRLYVKKGENL